MKKKIKNRQAQTKFIGSYKKKSLFWKLGNNVLYEKIS